MNSSYREIANNFPFSRFFEVLYFICFNNKYFLIITHSLYFLENKFQEIFVLCGVLLSM